MVTFNPGLSWRNLRHKSEPLIPRGRRLESTFPLARRPLFDLRFIRLWNGGSLRLLLIKFWIQMVHLEKLELSAAWVCVHNRLKGQFDRINPSLNLNLEGHLMPN